MNLGSIIPALAAERPVSSEANRIWMEVVWGEMKGQLTREVEKREMEIWVENSHPIRLMPGSPYLYSGPREQFENLSILDYGLLDSYGRAGVPSSAVERGIAAMIEQQKHKTPVNSVRYCHAEILRQAEAMKDARVGCFVSPDLKSPTATILIAVPRNGSAVYKARTRQQLLNRIARKINPALSVAITAAPDAYEWSELKRRFGWRRFGWAVVPK